MSRLLRTFSRSKIKKDKPGSPNSTGKFETGLFYSFVHAVGACPSNPNDMAVRVAVSPVSAEATSPPHELQPTVSATSAAEEGAKPTDMTVESAPATSSLSESDVAVSKSTTDVPSPPWAPLPAAAPPELTSDPPELPCPPGGECTFLSAEKVGPVLRSVASAAFFFLCNVHSDLRSLTVVHLCCFLSESAVGFNLRVAMPRRQNVSNVFNVFDALIQLFVTGSCGGRHLDDFGRIVQRDENMCYQFVSLSCFHLR